MRALSTKDGTPSASAARTTAATAATASASRPVAVLDVGADDAQGDRPPDGLARVAVPALEVCGHGQSDVAAAIRPTAASISSTGICSPSS